jgi:ElaB/YqjD/DUF883 family membrane-anchored ribosome-binding protein
MEDHNEPLLKQMEETRSSLTEKLEALENRVTGKVVQPVTNAVEKVTEAATDIVENVKDTVQSVTGKVEDAVQTVSSTVEDVVHTVTEKVENTAHAVASAFSLRRHTERHPWLVFGIAATTGCMVGSFLGRRASRQKLAPEASSGTRPRHHAKGTNGAAHHAETTAVKRTPKSKPAQHEGWVGEQMRRLKGLGIAALMGTVRDLARHAIPGPLGTRIAEEVETMTTKLGAEPIHGDILANFSNRTGNGRDDRAERTETSTTDQSESTPEPVNRLRTGGSSPGRN